MQVMAHGHFSNGSYDIYINGSPFKSINSGVSYWVWNFDSIIPAEATYRITGINNIIVNWEELR